jgi:two-component sensor histidine kinase
MASAVDLARTHAHLDGPRLAHLQRLVASWGPLSDLCFADLLLWVPVAEKGGGDPTRYVVVGQVRPTTSQTVYRQDVVGTVMAAEDRPVVASAYVGAELAEGDMELEGLGTRARVLAIPVRFRGEVVAVLSRDSVPQFGRQSGELERTYVRVFARFAAMIANGEFPFPVGEIERGETPRVGDGVVVLDEDARVDYASPNAVSALHRMGVHANVVGQHLADLGFARDGIRTAFASATPLTEELERGQDVTVVVRCIPMLEQGTVVGALLLVRDISELRHRDRLLLSKDATIREIHHRVKNNLQTVSSLLRLQGRRLESAEAKVAIEESVRRIRSIALVHETLSRDASDDVVFTDVVRPLVRMVEESLGSDDHPVEFRVVGDAGVVSARIATPLAVVITELLQNAVEHGFPDEAAGGLGHVEVRLEHRDDEATVAVVDDGVGLPEGFVLDEERASLGLSIVRALVTSEMAGTIRFGPNAGGRGTVAELRIPVERTGALEADLGR